MMFYDVRILRSRTLTISFENGRVEKVKFDESFGKAFRVLKDGFWGFYSTNEDIRIDEGIKRAMDNVVGKGDYAIADVEAYEGKFERKNSAEDVPIEQKVELMREVEKTLRDEHVVSTRIVYIENTRKFYYEDCNGVRVEYVVPRTGMIIQAVAKGKSLQFLSKRILKPAGFEIFKNNVFEMAEDVRNVLKDLVNAKGAPAGKMNVIVDPSLGGVLVHEAFGHAVEGDHVLQGASIVADKIGKRIANEKVYIYDDPTIMEFGFYPFDDEGVRARRRTIVEAGVLKSYLHSRETSAKLGGVPGNARAQGLDFPIVRMSNTFMDEGDKSFEELLELAREGVYLIGSRGGETDPATGHFQFNAQYGYIVRNGEIGEMIRDVSLSGNTLEILKNVEIGRKIEFDPGFCGKGGQLVPVADGSPPMLIRAIVGGVE